MKFRIQRGLYTNTRELFAGVYIKCAKNRFGVQSLLTSAVKSVTEVRYTKSLHCSDVSLVPAPSTDQENVIKQLQDGGDESGDIGERSRVEHLVDPAPFLLRLDNAC